jgi:hypothetical protein
MRGSQRHRASFKVYNRFTQYLGLTFRPFDLKIVCLELEQLRLGDVSFASYICTATNVHGMSSGPENCHLFPSSVRRV